MTKQLTTEQHQMLEDLTGIQYTRNGVPRKSKRTIAETTRLGLIDREHEETKIKYKIIDTIKVICKEQNFPISNHGIVDIANQMGITIKLIDVLLSGIRKE